MTEFVARAFPEKVARYHRTPWRLVRLVAKEVSIFSGLRPDLRCVRAAEFCALVGRIAWSRGRDLNDAVELAVTLFRRVAPQLLHDLPAGHAVTLMAAVADSWPWLGAVAEGYLGAASQNANPEHAQTANAARLILNQPEINRAAP